MKIVWILSITLFVVLFNPKTVSSIAYRTIINKLPVLPDSNTSKDGIIVRNSTECQAHCKDSRNILFARGRGGLRCLCSNESKPFRYGLVNSPGAVFKSEVRDVRGIDLFIYLGIKIVAISEIPVNNIRQVASVDTCALLCYNNRPVKCWGFSYDFDPLIPHKCRLFPNQIGKARYEVIPSNSTLVYFGFGGSPLTKFSRQWGLITSSNTYDDRNQFLFPEKDHLYFLNGVQLCAARCYNEFDMDCDHFYYDIEKSRCSFNSPPWDINSTSTFDPRLIYFRQDRTRDCSPKRRPTYFTSGKFRSPGFPYSYDKEPCSWKFLTPWGKALSVQLSTALPTRSVCKETVQINNASGRICQAERQIVGQSDNGLNTVDLKASDTKSNGIAFVADYKSVWACRPGKQPLLLQGPGEIATANYPSHMKSSACSWKISPGSTMSVSIFFSYFDFKSEPMLKSATLNISDAKGKSVLCNSTNSCFYKRINFTSPVVIDFNSGAYFLNPRGFRLTYDFNPVYPFPDVIKTKYLRLTGKGQVIEEAKQDLQLSRTVNLTYIISNTITDPTLSRIALTLNTILLGESSTDNVQASSCSNGHMKITDPAMNTSSYTYEFCNHEDTGTRIISFGNTLIVNVFIPPQSHLPILIPPKSFKFSVTNLEDMKNIPILLNATSLTFTSPNYPRTYPSNLNILWYLANVAGKLAVLSFVDVDLGQYQVLTNSFCNNDRLFVDSDGDINYLNCTVAQDQLPMRFVQRKILAVVLLTFEQYLASGFKATVAYYNKVGCNKTKDPVLIKGPGPIISAQYDSSTTGPCEWRVEMDLVIDCLEGCNLVKYIEPWTPYSKQKNFKSNIVYKGTIIQWRGAEHTNWFSALVSEIPSPTTATQPPMKSSTTSNGYHNATSSSGEGGVFPSHHHGSLSSGAIAGIVFGVIFLLLIIFVVVALFLLRRSGRDVQILERIRDFSANIRNPFARRSDETASPYKSFVDDDFTTPNKREEPVVKYHKEVNGDNAQHDMHSSIPNVMPGHIQIGGMNDVRIYDA